MDDRETQERNQKNERLIERLRESFTPMTARLTPEIEPALAYDPTAEHESE